MARDFSTMKTRVGTFIIDTSSSFATIIGYFINDKYRDVSKRSAWSALVDDNYTFATVASTAEYDLESDFDEEIFVANVTDGEEIKRYNEGGWWKERYSAYTSGSIEGGTNPLRYVILRESGKIKLDPTPSAIKTIAMPYKKLVTELSGATDTCIIHDIENIIEYGAIAEAYAYKRQFAKADYYFQKYEEELGKRISREKASYNMLHQRISENYGVAAPKRLLGNSSYV